MKNEILDIPLYRTFTISNFFATPMKGQDNGLRVYYVQYSYTGNLEWFEKRSNKLIFFQSWDFFTLKQIKLLRNKSKIIVITYKRSRCYSRTYTNIWRNIVKITKSSNWNKKRLKIIRGSSKVQSIHEIFGWLTEISK